MRGLFAASLLSLSLSGCVQAPAPEPSAPRDNVGAQPPSVGGGPLLATLPPLKPRPAGPVEEKPDLRPAPVEEKPIDRAAPPEEPPAFRFPDDAAGKLVQKALTPGVQEAPADHAAPRRRSSPLGVEEPPLSLPTTLALVPRLPQERFEQKLRPRLVLEETLDGLGEVARPRSAPMPEGERIRQPREDVTVPAPLPVLAVPLTDRAPLDDPTADASAEAALRAAMPLRQRPVPFQKTNLPDPFENRNAVKPPPLPREDAVPGHTTPPRPSRP
jgi:hypothetical protein